MRYIPSRNIPSYNDPELYPDSRLEHPHCKIGVKEIAAVLRTTLSGETTAKRLSNSRFNDCIAGDLFKVEIKGYVITFFVDDPGAFDYITSVSYGGKVSYYSDDWIYSPDDLLSEFEEMQLEKVLKDLS